MTTENFTAPTRKELETALMDLSNRFVAVCMELEKATGEPRANHTQHAIFNEVSALLVRVANARILATKITPAVTAGARTYQAENPGTPWERCLLWAYEDNRVMECDSRAAEQHELSTYGYPDRE